MVGRGTHLVEERRDKVHGLERVDPLGGGVVLVAEGGNDKHEEAHEKANLLHHLAAVEFVVNEERGEVVANHGDGDVDKIPRPGGHQRIGVVGNDLDELALEQLVTVEEYVVAEPGTGGGQESAAEMLHAVLEGGDIVSGDLRAALGLGQLLGGVWHLPGTVVDEPGSSDSREGKGETERILGGRRRVWGAAIAAVEDDEEDKEDNLVDKLAPALHQEGHGHTATTVQTILLGGESSRSDSVLERRGSGDGILASDTQAVEKQRPSIANNPALEGQTPTGCKHEQTDKHDEGILNKTPATTNPVTENLYAILVSKSSQWAENNIKMPLVFSSPTQKRRQIKQIVTDLKRRGLQPGENKHKTYTNTGLANHDADNLHVRHTSSPVLSADLVGLPALGPDLREQGLEVADGEEDVALEAEAGARDDGVSKVPADGGQRVLLHHAANGLQLLLGRLAVDLAHEGQALGQGEVGPVDTLGGVGVVRARDMAEDAALLWACVGVGIGARVAFCGALVVGLGSVGDGDLASHGAVVMMVVVAVVLLDGL